MTTTTSTLKYDMTGAGGVVGQNPFKAKACFEQVQKWKFVDKLNRLNEFKFSLPNDEYGRANAFVERNVFVPFIKPFHGFVTAKSQDETTITLQIKEFATHLERRKVKIDDEKRIMFTNVNWFDGEWKFRRQCIIDKGLVADEIKEFPILVSIPSNTGIKNHALETGNDILFTAKDGITKVPHEIEKYDATTGELVAHVKLPKITDASNSEFFIYYGNADATDQQDIVNVWKGTNKVGTGTAEITHDYAMVQHLNEDPTDTPPEYKDSTENPNDGTETDVTRIASKIGFGADFDSVASKIDCGSDTTIDTIFAGGGWLMAWIEPDSDGEANTGRILDKRTPTGNGWELHVQSEATGLLTVSFLADFTSNDGQWDTAVNIPINKKTFIAVNYNESSASNDPTIYINGEPRTIANGLLTESSVPSGSIQTDGGDDLVIGNEGGQANTFDGTIDEVRMSQVLPPNIDILVKTIFNNQNDPSAFITVLHQEQYIAKASVVAQQILDSANTDQPSGVTWILDEDVPGLVPTKGLVASFDFEDNVLDQHSDSEQRITEGAELRVIEDGTLRSTEDGTQNNAVVIGSELYVTGKLGKAFDFDGFSYITLTNEANFDFEFNTPFSVSFWVKQIGTGATTGYIVKADTLTAGTAGWKIFKTTDNLLRFRMSDGTTTHVSVTSTSIIADDKFHLCVITYDGSQNRSGAKLYVDKVLETTGTDNATSGTALNAEAVSIGATSDGSLPMTGQLDEVKIYKDKVLNQEEIDRLFEEGNSGITGEFNFKNHFEALQFVGEILGDDVWFDNVEHVVRIGTKGKTLDDVLDIIITSKPEVNTEDFANEINLVGAEKDTGDNIEDVLTTPTVLRFNYEKTIGDDQLGTSEQVTNVGNQLLKEFQKLTPQIRGEIPTHQFNRLNLESGDIVKIVQPEKQLNGDFRIMDIKVNSAKAKISLESTDTGTIRVRSNSFSDTIEGILKRINDLSL